MREQEIRIEQQVSELWLQLAAAEHQTEANAVRVKASEDALAGIIIGKDAGLWRVQDVLDATLEVQSARQEMNRAQYAAQKLKSELRIWTGQMMFSELAME